MTFIPPYTNTFRTVSSTVSNGTVIVTIRIPFDVDEIIFKGIINDFPIGTGTVTCVYTCPELTSGEVDAPIGYAQYSGMVEVANTSGSTVISYMYTNPRNINGVYTIRDSNTAYSGSFTMIVEFRK